MKINTMPKELACELLAYIAETVDFDDICKSIGEGIVTEEIKALLREIAEELRKEALAVGSEKYDVKKCEHLSKNAKEIISYLSPHEEKTLLKAFGLVEDSRT